MNVAGTEVLHLVVPADLRDRPTGGNVYDLELARALAGLGVVVHEHPVDVGSPLSETLGSLPDGSTVLVDGLLGLDAGHVLVEQRGRLRIWLLAHLPHALAAGDTEQARARERAALAAAAGVVATSAWTRRWLRDAYPTSAVDVRVARPGVCVTSRPERDETDGRRLLCLGAVVPAKGQDVLVSALTSLKPLPWECRIVGSLDVDPAFVDRLDARILAAGLAGRVTLAGPVPVERVGEVYAGADLLVHPSHLETYGMVVTEALASGLPVVASDVGGVREGLGGAGALVPPGDAAALAAALRRWWCDPDHRSRMRRAAMVRRAELADWGSTARAVRSALWGAA